MRQIYAHSLEALPPEKWQTLDEHLEGVAKISADFAEQFSSRDWAHNATSSQA